MERKKSHIETLFAGYFSGNLCAEERHELKAWIDAAPENRKYFLSMQEIWFSTIGASGNGHRFDKGKAYQRFLARIGKDSDTRRHSARWRILWQSAAAAVVLGIVAYTSFRQGSEHVKDQFADITIEAPPGSRIKTYLPDGTLVWLNTGSKIVYSQGFGFNERKVNLSGEGYFEVAKDEKLPFSIQTEELNVIVVGTIFNFRNYPDDLEATVSLLKGKVLVDNQVKKGESSILSPGQKIFLDKKSGEMRLIRVNAQNTVEWKNGYLFFDDELLPDIVRELERSYDVKIILTHPKLEKLRFYSCFIRGELSIEEVVDILASTGNLQYSKNGKEIRLSPGYKN
jgi:ferric-dicitrate binding protein FerR (iron transport regulator)